MLATLLALLAYAATSDPPVPLAFEEPRSFLLEQGATRRFRVVPRHDGAITVDAESMGDGVSLTPIGVDVVGRHADRSELGIAFERLVLTGTADEAIVLEVRRTDDEPGDQALRVTAWPFVAELSQGDAGSRLDFYAELGVALEERGLRSDAAIALCIAGETGYGLGRFATCRRTYARVLELSEGVADLAAVTALARARIGALHAELDSPRLARRELERALEEARALDRPTLELFVQMVLGRVHVTNGDLEEAERVLVSALELARATGSGHNEVVACSILAELRARSGDVAGAERWFGEAETIARGGGDPAVLARALLVQGEFRLNRSELSRARSALAEAHELAPGTDVELEVLGALGTLALVSRDELAAVGHFELVLARAREIGALHLETDALVSLGLAAVQLGDWEEAKHRLVEAIDAMGPEAPTPERAEALRALGVARLELGEPEAARACLDQALALAEELGDARILARALADQVDWYARRGELEQALAPARRVHELGREHGLPDCEATGLDLLAELYLRSGELQRAGELAARSIELCRRLEDPELLQWALLTSVDVAVRNGDARAVAGFVDEAHACFERADLSRLDPERIAMLRARDVFSLWSAYSQDNVALSLGDCEPDSDEAQQVIAQGFQRAGLWKGRALLQGIAEHRGGGRDAQTIELRRRLAEARAEKNGLLARMAEAHREDATEGLEELRARAAGGDAVLRDLEARLRAHAPADAALDVPEGVTPEELSDSLASDVVLIEYVSGKERLYAYVLRDGELRFHDLGARVGLESEVAEFLAGIANPDRLAGPAEVARRGRLLHAALLSPLLDGDESGEERLVIVPSANLAALPFEALVVEAEGKPRDFAAMTFVLDRHEVGYATSTPILVLLADVGPRAEPGPALIVADPVYASEAPYAGEPPVLRNGDPSWERLPGTRDEALAVARALTGEESALPGGIAPTRSVTVENDAYRLHVGEDASPDRLRGDLRRFAIVHCASHGWSDPVDPRKSGLVLSPTAEGDGVLRVGDILELDLDADLAVLSACETGRGAIRRGEGVQSIARAFLYAGARSVVSSLWQVDDRETGEVMERFYGAYVGAGDGPLSALRSARLAVRHGVEGTGRYRGVGRGIVLDADSEGGAASPENRIGHPFFWASFVYVGRPR